ncbi:hypothetical protein ENBRE01_3176 [Enteropsectra breve]|nr:hypothetical protein ENBRE01_3176 [Enteropsectra breve]
MHIIGLTSLCISVLCKKSDADTESRNFSQQLVFDKEISGRDAAHICDVKIHPAVDIIDTVITRKIANSNDPNSAAPVQVIHPEESPLGSAYFRLEIPDNLDKEDTYHFQFTYGPEDSDVLYSEPWGWSEKDGKWALTDAIKKPFYKKKLFIGLASAGAIAGGALGLGSLIRARRHRKAAAI